MRLPLQLPTTMSHTLQLCGPGQTLRKLFFPKDLITGTSQITTKAGFVISVWLINTFLMDLADCFVGVCRIVLDWRSKGSQVI